MSMSKGIWQMGMTSLQKLRRAATLLVGLMVPLALSGCMEGGQLSFAAAPGAGSALFDRSSRVLTTTFGNGQLILAAPPGFCFDVQMQKHSGKGGFALLARCDRMRGARRLGRGEGVVVTATVGAVSKDTATPTAAALHRAYVSSRAGARLLEQREDRNIPLVKLHQNNSSTTPGASPTHWRGAFVENGHLVAVALYAPAGSSYLGDRGASLIREFMRASRSASALARQSQPEPDQADSAPRPHLRPADQNAAAARTATAD